MVFIIFLFINSFHLFYIIFISESIISLCHQLSWTTFWMPWVIKTYHTHTPDRLCRYSPHWCVLSTGAYYLCFLVQLLVPAYYTQVRTIPREIRYIVSEKLHTSRGRRRYKKTANNKIVALMRREKQTNTSVVYVSTLEQRHKLYILRTLKLADCMDIKYNNTIL